MLHYKTIKPETLGILKKIQQIEELSNLRLVGGTALALQIGHRISVDIDLFGTIKADNIAVSQELKKIGKLTIIQNSKNINIYLINNIKVDIVNYPYPWLENIRLEDDILLANLKDIAAMKISAITGRGTKKDFIDLYFLLKHYTLKEILDFYVQKYDDASIFMALKSLSYFIDADEDEQPEMIKHADWNEVKNQIVNTLENYIKNN